MPDKYPFGVERTTDPRVTFLDMDVVAAAFERLRHVCKSFDHVYVSFSGGKDSLAVLWLVRDIFDEMGWQDRPVPIIFRDEEMIPDDVIAFVLRFLEDPRFRLHYFAIPMKNSMFIMGEHRPYIQWDPAREWVRPKPECAIEQLHPDNLPLRQTEVSPLAFHHLGVRGRIAVINGIRADESRMRRNSCLSKRNEYNYIVRDASGAGNIFFVKPIYDWSQGDVFRYFYDQDIEFAQIYNAQTYAMQPLRVSTPLHDQSYEMLRKLRITYPKLYEQIVSIFPDVATHERYWGDFDEMGIIYTYPKNFEGIVAYIHEHVDSPRARKAALSAVRAAKVGKDNNRRQGLYATEGHGRCYGYPILYVFRSVVTGRYTDGIQVKGDPSSEEVSYERQAEQEAMEIV